MKTVKTYQFEFSSKNFVFEMNVSRLNDERNTQIRGDSIK